jgi:hypothetical protein
MRSPSPDAVVDAAGWLSDTCLAVWRGRDVRCRAATLRGSEGLDLEAQFADDPLESVIPCNELRDRNLGSRR